MDLGTYQNNIDQMKSFLKFMLKKENIDCSNLKFLYYHSYKNGNLEEFGFESVLRIYLFQNNEILYLLDPEQLSSSKDGVIVSQINYKSFILNE